MVLEEVKDRAGLRDFFEVDAKHIAFAALRGLMKEERLKSDVVKKAMKDLEINPDQKKSVCIHN